MDQTPTTDPTPRRRADLRGRAGDRASRRAPVVTTEAHHRAVTTENTEAVLTVENLKMYFPVKSSGILRRTIGHVQAVDGVSFQLPSGRVPRAGGRVRLRQVDDRSPGHPALRAHGRHRSTSTGATSRTCRRGASSRSGARSR